MARWPVPAGTSGCVILGAGGHAKVVLDALVGQSRWSRFAFVDRDAALRGTRIAGVPVVGGDDELAHAGDNGFTHFVVGLGGIGDNAPRRLLFERGLAAGLRAASIVHPAATAAPSAVIGEGTVVFAGAVVNPDAVVGRNVILNTRCIVEHDSRIGDHVQVSPGAVVLGGVTIDRMAYVGAGAVVMQGVQIGEGAVIGAGAVVLRDVAAGERAVGVPAVCTPRR